MHATRRVLTDVASVHSSTLRGHIKERSELSCGQQAKRHRIYEASAATSNAVECICQRRRSLRVVTNLSLCQLAIGQSGRNSHWETPKVAVTCLHQRSKDIYRHLPKVLARQRCFSACSLPPALASHQVLALHFCGAVNLPTTSSLSQVLQTLRGPHTTT